jgi:hypothetical protein
MAARESLSNQFITVHHSSYDDSPPHHSWDERDHIFAGTDQAAYDRMERSPDRRFVHQYRIPVSMVRPELWADDQHDRENSQIVHDLADHPGPTLWETLPVDPYTVKPGEVLQYRNQFEDVGSISYIMHKLDILNRKIKYNGYIDMDEE